MYVALIGDVASLINLMPTRQGIGRRDAGSRDGTGRPCSEIDGFSPHYSRRHMRPESGAGALHRIRSCGPGCRFQKLDSSVPVMQSAQDCMCDDVPEAVERAPGRRILSERIIRTPPIVIGGEFRKDPPQVLFVEHDQMIGTLAPDRSDQALNMAVLPGRAE